MNSSFERPSQLPRGPDRQDPYKALDRAIHERFGFGYPTYYMRRLRATEEVRSNRADAARALFKEDKTRYLVESKRWENLLLRYCEDETILEYEYNAAMALNEQWMIEAQSNALKAVEDFADKPS